MYIRDKKMELLEFMQSAYCYQRAYFIEIYIYDFKFFFYFDIQSLPVHNDVFCILFQIDNTKKKKKITIFRKDS